MTARVWVAVALVVTATGTTGCLNQPGAVGPHRIEGPGLYGPQTYYARLTPKSELRNVMAFTGAPYRELRFVDEVTGESKLFVSDTRPISYTLVRLDEHTYENEVREAKAKVDQVRRQLAEADARDRARRQELWKLEQRVYEKDWQRLFDAFRADGYADDEAAYKADRIMRGR